jgi:hypothetical protein
MKARSARVGILAVMCAVGALVGGSSSASASIPCSLISGAGSSLQTVAQTLVWAPNNPDMECAAPLPVIHYFPTSSGKGEAQWGDNATQVLTEEAGVSPFPAFIGTDVGPEGPALTAKTQLNNIDAAGLQGLELDQGVLTVPVAQSAISVLVTLPLGCSATTSSTPQITSLDLENLWLKNEGLLENIFKNAGVKCLKTPELYARESASGTTAGFKRFLDVINHAGWGALVTTAVKAENTEWPGAVLETGFGKGSQLAEGVFSKPGANGAVGYADLADALKAGFSTKVTLHTVGTELLYSFIAEVQNNPMNAEEGPTYASPLASGGSASNCANATYNAPNRVLPNMDWSGARQNNVEGGTAYPICTLTFDLAWHEYGKPKKGGVAVYTEAQRNTVFNYLLYIVNEGQNAALESNHYGKLTGTIATSAINGVTGTNIKF